MSNVYILEPPTSGKVLLKTTVGDIDIELWGKETPKTCRNFIQLCLEGYYNGTIFHRVVKDFIVQGGDPKGDGTGGESIYGEPFKDEFHSRLRFTRRGILAMANAGKDDNGSQFFFTMGPTPELQNKHTIFGKVTGETIFNMLRLAEGLIENERPAYPHKIIKAEVLSNPFPDIEPRILETTQNKSEKRTKEKKPGVKNFKLLSFGEEAEEDEEETFVANKTYAGKGKSTHDLLSDPTLSSEPVVDVKKDKSDESEESEIDHEEELENIRKKLKSEKKKTTPYYLNKDEKDARKRKAEEIREEIAKVKKEYKENKLTKEAAKSEDEKKKQEKSETFKAYTDEYNKYKDKKNALPKKGKSREQFTLELLNKFKKKLDAVKEKVEETGEPEDKEDKSDSEDTWLAHKLTFGGDSSVLAKDANTKGDDWYEVYDPRNPLNKRRREESKKVLGKKSSQKH